MHNADKLDLLTSGASYDLACACGGEQQSRIRGSWGRWIYPAVLPDGSRVPLLKILLSNSCSRDCVYCANRRGRRFIRTSFRPEEMAQIFMELNRQGRVGGLFLSSAISGSVINSMEQMLKTIELVRFWHGYKGWVHLKILPGASRQQVERAARLANRLSLNLEAPSPARPKAISSKKRFTEDIYRRMEWIQNLAGSGGYRCRGQTTQFVVGAGEETDREFAFLSGKLYSNLGMSRVYYSAFQPVKNTPLWSRPPAAFEREHRLYQADFLLRKYGFTADELVFDRNGNLPLDKDPKTSWASIHPEAFPVEVNTAPLQQLLRIPGIGPVAATRIIKSRRQEKLSTLDHLKSTGARADCAPFILLDGKRPAEVSGAQLSLFVPAAGFGAASG